MTRYRYLWPRLLAIVGLALAGVLTTTQLALADGILRGSTIPSGTTIENDAILWGNDVVVDGTVDGDVFAFGRTVTVNGSVAGSLITGGETVAVNGKVGGSVYAVAVAPSLGPSSVVERTAYLVGVRVATDPGSRVGRDLAVVALGAQLGGEVGRQSKVTVGLLEFIRIFQEAVDWQRGQIRVGAVLPEALDLQESALGSLGLVALRGSGLVDLSPAVGDSDAKTVAKPAGQVDAYAVQTWFLDRLRELVVLLVVGALTIWLIPAHLERWSGLLKSRLLAAAGLGMVTLVTGFAGPVLLVALIFATGLALALASFWTPAILVWGLGFSALSLAFFAFLLMGFYGSKVIVGYLVGSLILGRWTPRAARYKILPMLLGIVLFVLLRSIPILGWVIGIVVTFFGLGAVWLREYGVPTSNGQQVVECKAPSTEAAEPTEGPQKD